MNKKTLAAGAAAVALTGTLIAGGTAAASDCPAGQTKTAMGCGTVQNSAETGFHTGTTSFVTPAVGVDFRDDSGRKTGSGFYPANAFEYLGKKKHGINGDGTLILVRQMTKKKDGAGITQSGYGSLYRGWIPAKYTQVPSMFD